MQNIRENWRGWVLGSGIAAFLLGHLANNYACYDIWTHLNFGRFVITNLAFPFQDSFSYLPTKALWIYHEWLSSIIFFLIYKFLGGAGLQFFRYSLALATIGLTYLTAKKRGSYALFAAMALIVSIPIIKFGYAPVRAQIFTYFFFALTIYLLESAKKEQKWHYLWWLLPIQLIWANTHGAFVAGLGICALYILGEALNKQDWKPYFKILVLSTLITLINPYGIKLWDFIVTSSAKGVWPELTEWYSVFTAFGMPAFKGYYLVYLILVAIAGLIIMSNPKRNLTSTLVLMATAFLGFKHIRHIVFFGLAFAAYLPSLATGFWQSLQKNEEIKQRWGLLGKLTSLWIILWLSYVVFFFIKSFVLGNPFALYAHPFEKSNLIAAKDYYPVKAVNYIKKKGLKGNILAPFEW